MTWSATFTLSFKNSTAQDLIQGPPFPFTSQTFLSLPPCRLELTLNYSPSPSADDSVKRAQIKHIRLFKQAGSGPLSSQQRQPASQPANSIYVHGCAKSSRKLESQPCSLSLTYVLFQSMSLFICLFLFLGLSFSLSCVCICPNDIAAVSLFLHVLSPL